VLTLPDVDRILTERGLRAPAIRLVRDGSTIAPAAYTKTLRLQSRPVSDFIDAGRVYALFGEGATIVLQALHRYWEPLAHFCRELELELTHPVQANVYVTPPRARGLDVHYDTHDVFVLQVSGTKLWKVYGAAVDLPLAHQRREGAILDPGEPQLDIELHPGDCLYIPRGFLHAAETARSESTHMTVGILTYRWMDVISSVMRKAGDELFLRAALRPGFAHDEVRFAGEIAETIAGFARWLEQLETDDIARSFSERFWANRAPQLTGQLQQVLSLDSLGEDSIVQRRVGATCYLKSLDDEIVIVLGDRKVHVPEWLRPALDHILDGRQPFKVAELASYLDPQGSIVLVRRLIREGLLEQVPSG
jgi:bifunctional lysine-specific demethylase and histidyl-hydroxylase NO66